MKSQPVVFENPPINEVVVAVNFKPALINLRSEHIGLFWAKIKEDFPIVEQKIPTSSPLEPSSFLWDSIIMNEPFPMPRYWFISADQTNLIQIEKNTFVFNWRRKEDAYPRFHQHIKPAFDKYYGRFSEFIQGELRLEEPAADFCELTYINILEPCEYWSGPKDTARVIPEFSTVKPQIVASVSSEFNCTYIYKTNDLELRIGIRNGFKTKEPGVPILAFEIKTSRLFDEPVEKAEADKWFERAHEAVVNCFLEMTSPKIQNDFWNLVEPKND